MVFPKAAKEISITSTGVIAAAEHERFLPEPSSSKKAISPITSPALSTPISIKPLPLGLKSLICPF